MRGRREVIVTAVAIFICTVFAHSGFTYPTVFPTGVTIYKPDKCYNGYTLYPIRGVSPVLLLDMNGNVVHTWNIKGGKYRLLLNGHLLTMRNGLTEYDWDGNVVWKCEIGRTHHSLERLSNGNTICLCKETVPEKYMKLVEDPERRAVKLHGSCIYEVNPKGEVVWEWHEYKHLDLNTYSPTDALADWTHTNTVEVLPENHWYNEGHKEFKPGNVLTNPRHFKTCFIIDKETKEIVWTYTGDYKGGLAHPHEPHMIEPGLPGAGNILIFDNGIACKKTQLHTGKSFVLEINPVTKEIVWKYESPWFQFFSPTNGSAHRLPNGNTLIDEDDIGRTFEVTPEGEIVWEYMGIGKYAGHELITTGGEVFCDPGHKVLATRTKRPYRYPYDYCPQMKVLPKPKELAVTPPKSEDWHLVPDALR